MNNLSYAQEMSSKGNPKSIMDGPPIKLPSNNLSSLGLYTYYKSGQLFRTSGGGASDPESNKKDNA
jgi:hypothetical protein